eukprot:TRINITY_DN847_c0_g1_i10.p2 TRINITY_DN847_c0_g1~~TRINITY_DN847_c0_g1_i10.p2  ORF type:complete len:105 (+),score=6.70 TRINITY_DN847_c0_g1_i10:1091-1405(+)
MSRPLGARTLWSPTGLCSKVADERLLPSVGRCVRADELGLFQEDGEASWAYLYHVYAQVPQCFTDITIGDNTGPTAIVNNCSNCHGSRAGTVKTFGEEFRNTAS